MKKKTLALILAMFFVLSLFSACGSSSAPASSAAPASEAAPAESASASTVDPASVKGELTLYTSEPEDQVTEFIAAFNKIYPNVKINMFRSGTGKVTAKMDTEFQTGDTEANIIWFADIGYIKGLDDKGLILHNTPAAASGLDASTVYNDGMGIEVRKIYNVLAYNTTKIDASKAPKDWMDVTTADYKGVFGMANPNYSGGAFTALVVHVQNEDKVGWKFYEQANANGCKYEESNGNLKTKVASGEYSAVAIVDSHARSAMMEGSPVQIVWPTSGAVLIPTPMALMKNIPAESLDAAKAFEEFMLSKDAQKMFVDMGYVPSDTSVGLPDATPDKIVTLPFDLDYFVKNSKSIREQYVAKFGE